MKPPIPDANFALQGEARKRFDRSVKESLEVIMGRRGGAITPLADDATLPEVVAKVNEILELLQG